MSLVSALTKIEDDLRAVLQQMRENRSKGHELYNQAQISANDKDDESTNRNTEEEVTENMSDANAKAVPTKTAEEILTEIVTTERKLAEQVHRRMSILKHV